MENGVEGDAIEIGSGVFRLERPLSPKPGMTLRGAGMAATVITHMATWRPSTKALSTPEATLKGFDKDAYLIRLPDGAAGVSLSDLTLRGPGMHGAIFGVNNREVDVSRVRIQDFLANGIRTFGLKSSRIVDCEFIDAGGRWERGGIRGVDGGVSGGGRSSEPGRRIRRSLTTVSPARSAARRGGIMASREGSSGGRGFITIRSR